MPIAWYANSTHEKAHSSCATQTSDMIEFECPHCHRILKVPEQYAGRSGKCNHCGNAISIVRRVPSDQLDEAEQFRDDSAAIDIRVETTVAEDLRVLLRQDEGNRAVTATRVHFGYQELIQMYYKKRNTEELALDLAIHACEQQIVNSPRTKSEMLEQYDRPLPTHVGYKQLAIIRDKQSNYQEAIRLCEEAQSEGWNGDWDKRLSRLRKKAGLD